MGRVRKLTIQARALPLVAEGFSTKRAKKWVRRVRRNSKAENGYTRSEKRWAYKHGYMPGRVRRFGINDKNLNEFVSEKDYYYIQPVNGIYRKLLMDKLTVRKVFSPFSDHLQELYYRVRKKKDELIITRLDDCPYEEESMDAIIKLIREKEKLVITDTSVKRSIFLSWENNIFSFGGKLCKDEEELIRSVKRFDREFLVAEFVQPSAEFENHYHRYGNQIRLVVMNDNMTEPQIGEAFIRTDSHYTGNIDDLRNEIRQYYQGTDPEVPSVKTDEYDDDEDEEEVDNERLEVEEETVEEANEEPFSKADAEDYVEDEDLCGELTAEEQEILNGLDEEEQEAAEAFFAEEGEKRKKKRGYFRGIVSFIDLESGIYDGGKLVLDDEVIEVRENYLTGDIIEGRIPFWNEMLDTVKRMCIYVPQLEFFSIDVVITDKTFKFIKFSNIPKYPSVQPFSEKTTKFLKNKAEEKRKLSTGCGRQIKRACRQFKLKVRKNFAKAFFPKKLLPYLSVRWIGEVTADLFTNKDTGIKKKLWAYKNGFISYRLDQYGITKENREKFISDFEYKWLRHINGKYRIWFEDKITFKYILSDFADCFPEYYYNTAAREGANLITAMPDLPEGYERTYDDILRLAREKGALALKPDEGSHGDGFYKLSYTDKKYYLNFDQVSEEDVIAVLDNRENSYLITEYIDNHPQFKEIYAGAVNTVRMIVYNRGKGAVIGNAYMRIGSTKTGAVDNMGAGGMFAEIDLETGRYGSAKIISGNSIKDCPRHPDTGTLIEGFIPNWENVKATVLAISDSIPELEYLGFDVAITEKGVKMPEINRFPDYPKIEKFSPGTIEFLLEKLNEKKKMCGYDVKPCRKLVSLPERTS